VIVVGDIRDKKTGEYRRFPDSIKDIFQKHGMTFINEIILDDGMASIAPRINKLMRGRKIGKIHQNMLVFYKGKLKDVKDNFDKLTINTDNIITPED
jgi:hypothetical protein